MNVEKLIENAVLDAMGLLDDTERSEFEREFNRAAPTVQAMVRREQTRLCVIERLLPDVEPPAGLRAAVLEAVRDAMTADQIVEQRMALPFSKHKVSSVWRAGAFGAAAAAIAFAVMLVRMNNQFDNVTRSLQDEARLGQPVEAFGQQFPDTLFHASTIRVMLSSDDPESVAVGSVWFNPEWPSAKLYVRGLPAADEPYRVALLDEEGNVEHVLTTFTSERGIRPIEFLLDASDLARLAVLAPESAGGGVLIRV